MDKIEQARQTFIDNDLYFLEFKRGYFQVETISFWAQSGTWIDREFDKRGLGIDSLLKYIEVIST